MPRGIALAITLAQAAEATGRNRSTILRGIRRGTVSATRDQRTQAWMVDPSELFRVFPPAAAQGSAQAALGNAAQPYTGDGTTEMRVLAARLDAAEARIADRDELISEQRSMIDDMRRRLDAEAEERRRLTAILADQRAAPAPSRRWWPWRR